MNRESADWFLTLALTPSETFVHGLHDHFRFYSPLLWTWTRQRQIVIFLPNSFISDFAVLLESSNSQPPLTWIKQQSASIYWNQATVSLHKQPFYQSEAATRLTYQQADAGSHNTLSGGSWSEWRDGGRGTARIFLRGGAEVMETKALKRKNCLWWE